MTVPPGPLPGGLDRDTIVAEVGRVLTALPHGASALVAISGGPDSTALAHLVAEARPDLALHLAHVRHGLRDDEADVRLVEAHAAALGLPLEIRAVEVAGSGDGVEAAARDARYRGLRRIASDVGAAWVLLGHTADDQAETVLLRIARGTGVDGLGAMTATRPDVGDADAGERDVVLVRPLLRVRRADVRGFIAGEGLAAVEDPMNRDRAFTRVRARHELLPALGEVGPDPVGALGRLADLARDDARALALEAAAAYAQRRRRYGPVECLPDRAVHEADPARARRLVRHLLAAVSGDPLPVEAAHVQAVLELDPGAAVDVPGSRVTRGGGWLAAAPHGLERPQPAPVAVPGTTPWSAAGLEIVATTGAEDHDGQLRMPLGLRWSPPRPSVPGVVVPPGGDAGLGTVVLGPGALRGLTVRARREGDRVTAAAGTRKLQDVLVDAGVPRAVRDLLPVVERDGAVLWIPGVAVDAEAARAGRERPAVRLHVRSAGP